jgi:hypothetical protein
MFFKRRPLCKRAWITAADVPLWGWIHSEKPKSYYKNPENNGEYALLSKTAMRILGLEDVKSSELVEIEITVTECGEI